MGKTYKPVKPVIKAAAPWKSLRPVSNASAGGGSWIFVPGLMSNMAFPGKAAGKAGGKGRLGVKKVVSKYEEKLRKMDPSLKVWVGDLSPKTTWKALEKHFTEVAKPAVVDVWKNGTAVVAFKNAEDVDTAVASLNGSELDGNTIMVDVWVQKPKTEKPEGKATKKKPQAKPKARAPLGKMAKTAKSKADDKKAWERLAGFDAAQKVWIGGLSPATTWKALEEHLATVSKPKFTHVMNKGKAVAAYEKPEDALSVISTLTGSELEGKVLEVDVWTELEKKEKKEKGKKGQTVKEETA